jgi:hypothetical protein
VKHTHTHTHTHRRIHRRTGSKVMSWASFYSFSNYGKLADRFEFSGKKHRIPRYTGKDSPPSCSANPKYEHVSRVRLILGFRSFYSVVPYPKEMHDRPRPSAYSSFWIMLRNSLASEVTGYGLDQDSISIRIIRILSLGPDRLWYLPLSYQVRYKVKSWCWIN